MTKGYFRGHSIIWINDQWLYVDNREPLPATGGKIRPCMKCGKLFPLESHDLCLGILPVVDNACCGHGICSEAFIRFKDGLVIKDFIIEKD